MRKKISVIGKGVNVGDDLAAYVAVSKDLRGADVVVLAGDVDLEELWQLAPAAAVLVTGDSLERRCKEVYEATLFPRPRIIGVTDPAPVAESILFERDDEHEVVAMVDGEFAPRKARVGRGGIRALL